MTTTAAKVSRARRYARWTLCWDVDCTECCILARRCGMKVIHAVRPGMHVYSELALYGTPAQMRATEAAWEAAGLAAKDIKNRRPPGGFSISLNWPRDRWYEGVVDWAAREAEMIAAGRLRAPAPPPAGDVSRED